MRPSTMRSTSSLNAWNSESPDGGGSSRQPACGWLASERAANRPPAPRRTWSQRRPDGVDALEAERSRRHRDPNVLAGDRDRGGGVAPLVRVDESLEQRAVPRRSARGVPHSDAARREVVLHRGAGALQRAVGRGDAGIQQLRRFVRRPAQHVRERARHAGEAAALASPRRTRARSSPGRPTMASGCSSPARFRRATDRGTAAATAPRRTT